MSCWPLVVRAVVTLSILVGGCNCGRSGFDDVVDGSSDVGASDVGVSDDGASDDGGSVIVGCQAICDVDADARFISDETGHCYTRHDTPNGWYGARPVCNAIGAGFVSYTSAAEAEAVVAGLDPVDQAWVGLVYHGGWTWDSGEPAVYGNWGPGEPTAAVEQNVAAHNADGTWFNAGAHDGAPPRSFICEFSVHCTADGHSYQVFYDASSWALAVAACQSRGGHLATIHSADELRMISEVVTREDTWIGLSDEGEEGTWAWVTGESLDFEAWSPGEPGGTTGENCANVRGEDHQWEDLQCDALLPYLCEFE